MCALIILGYKLAKSHTVTGSKYAPSLGVRTVAPLNFSSSESLLYCNTGTRYPNFLVFLKICENTFICSPFLHSSNLINSLD